MSFIEHDGATIWYDAQGEGEPLAVIGGDCMASDQFHFVLPALIQRFRLVRWDFRGLGNSDRNPQVHRYVIDEKVEDMKAVLDAAGIERTHIWAIATGTYTGVTFAARYPERVGAIIHYGQCQPTEGGFKIFGILDRIHKEFDWPTACEHMVHLYAPKPEFMDWTIAVYVKNTNADWLKSYWDELNADITEELRQTTAPMLVLIGAQGPLGAGTSYGSGWETTKACRPDAELEVVEGGTGTYYMVDQADEAVQKVTAFLERHPLGAGAAGTDLQGN